MSIEMIIKEQLITPHFQGIINFYTESFLAFEALVRTSPCIPSISPDQLFDMAEKHNLLLELDLLCVKTSIDNFKNNQLPGLLFVNIFPINLRKISAALDITFAQDSLKGIVFEISEKHPLNNREELKEHVNFLRKHGALIAIDDLGAGHSGLISWAEIKPDFVKIDRHFIDNIHNDGVKREFVRSIVEIARGLRCKVIAEGIEKTEELDTLHTIGITLGQGYLLHRPEATPPLTFTNTHYFSTVTTATQTNYTRHADTAEIILENISPISPKILSDEINDLFKHHPEIRCLPITDDSKPVGMISRRQVLELFSGRYSYPLHGHKSISCFMDTEPLIVEYNESLQSVSNKITQNAEADLNTDFIITKSQRYIGVGKVSNLLKRLTESQVQHARHSNPLTLLPGNVPINEHIEDLINQQQSFHLAYFDINDFKPFNDFFGYSYGDEVIKSLSEIIIKHTSRKLDMVGHIGGDDFIVVFRSNNWKYKCEVILSDFKNMALKFYSKEAVAEQGIWYQGRSGKHEFFNLLSLAIGIVYPETNSKLTHHEVSELAADAKKQAKQQRGNALYISHKQTVNTGSNIHWH